MPIARTITRLKRLAGFGAAPRQALGDGSSGPLGDLNSGLRDTHGLVFGLLEQVREIDRGYRALQAASARAWTEREALSSGYYRLLHRVIESLEAIPDDPAGEGGGRVRRILTAALAEEGVETMDVTAGDAFDGAFHVCAQTLDREDLPAGAVVGTLSPGWVRKLADGTREVVRPAEVTVSRNPPQASAEEQER